MLHECITTNIYIYCTLYTHSVGPTHLYVLASYRISHICIISPL